MKLEWRTAKNKKMSSGRKSRTVLFPAYPHNASASYHSPRQRVAIAPETIEPRFVLSRLRSTLLRRALVLTDPKIHTLDLTPTLTLTLLVHSSKKRHHRWHQHPYAHRYVQPCIKYSSPSPEPSQSFFPPFPSVPPPRCPTPFSRTTALPPSPPPASWRALLHRFAPQISPPHWLRRVRCPRRPSAKVMRLRHCGRTSCAVSMRPFLGGDFPQKRGSRWRWRGRGGGGPLRNRLHRVLDR